MAARTIRVGIYTFTDGHFAYLGDEVDVPDEELERFDSLNPAEPEPEEPEGDGESSDEPEGDKPTSRSRGK